MVSLTYAERHLIGKEANSIRFGELIGTATLGAESGDIPPADREVAEHIHYDDDLGWHVPAWKAAWLAKDEAGAEVFLPLTADKPYGIDSTATCARKCGSQPPNLLCSCGFYACLDALSGEEVGVRYCRPRSPDWLEPAWPVLLEVAMTGFVAVFEGWPSIEGRIIRAQSQRILSYKRFEPTRPGIRSSSPVMLGKDEGGSLARRVAPPQPGSGPMRLNVPTPDWPVTSDVAADGLMQSVAII